MASFFRVLKRYLFKEKKKHPDDRYGEDIASTTSSTELNNLEKETVPNSNDYGSAVGCIHYNVKGSDLYPGSLCSSCHLSQCCFERLEAKMLNLCDVILTNEILHGRTSRTSIKSCMPSETSENMMLKQLALNSNQQGSSNEMCNGPDLTLSTDMEIHTKVIKIQNIAEKSIMDMCGHRWQVEEILSTNGCLIQTKQSDVRLTISQGSVECSTTISGSILLDIPFIRKTFKLQRTHIIVAPPVEYQLQDMASLKTHACLELPHCMNSQKVHKMQVWCFESVSGRITQSQIPQGNQGQDIYWVTGKRRNTINVFAKHFCVILCTACEEDVEFEIRAFLYHRFGDDPASLSLTLHLQLGGPLAKIKDFEQALREKMERKNMKFIDDTDVDLYPRLEGDLKFYLDFPQGNQGKWVHIVRGNGQLVYEREKILDVKRISRCGNEHVIDVTVRWWLQRQTVGTKACSFFTDVKHDISNGESTVITTMHGEIPVPKNYFGHIHNTETGDPDDSNLSVLNKDVIDNMQLDNSISYNVMPVGLHSVQEIFV
ncbi:uncharacterized protein [Argopecten irradians]|uniref:uncharacterized protein n=1 Tax=Argopecten irradians TaxID=31199 RepID=UPI00372471ED